MTPAEKKQYRAMTKAIRVFATAWAAWHNHSNLNLGDTLLNAGHDLLPAAGLEMVEITGIQMIVEAPTKKRKTKAP